MENSLNFGEIKYTDLSKKKDEAQWSPGGVKYFSALQALHFTQNGEIKGAYDLGSGVVTNVGVIYMSQAMTGASSAINNFNYHDSGTSTDAAAVTDTSVTLSSGIPGRATGSQTCPTTGQYRTVATQTYTSGGVPISEWGLFSQVTGGTLWDRKTFGTITVANGDSIQFTYSLTIVAGG